MSPQCVSSPETTVSVPLFWNIPGPRISRLLIHAQDCGISGKFSFINYSINVLFLQKD